MSRPDFWDVILIPTLKENELEYKDFDLSSYPWFCEQIDDIEEAYNSGEISPLEARIEIFNAAVTQYSEHLNACLRGASDSTPV